MVDDDDISCFDADNSSDDNKSFSSVSDDEYDYEDSNNVDFVMSSVQQDEEMKLFTDWLESIDGGKKSPREAQKHRSTVLQVLRYDPDNTVELETHTDHSYVCGFSVSC